jgi:superfamily II DNA or RNA helicase
MSAIVSKYGIIISGLADNIITELKKEYTLKLPITYNAALMARQNGYIPEPELFEVFYMNSNNHLVLPRNAILNPAVNKYLTAISVSAGNPGDDLPADREFGIELLGNQELVVNHVVKTAYNPARIAGCMGTALLQLGTGSGKTYVGAAIIHNIGKKALWILPNTSILEQTAEVLEIAFPNLKVGRWFSERKDSPADHHIILILVDSLLAMARLGAVDFAETIEISKTTGKRNPVTKISYKKITKKVPIAEWMNCFGITIFDEIHTFLGMVYSTIFWFFSSNIVFSMSATVNENKKGLDKIYKMHYGQEIVGAEIPGFQLDELPWKRRLKVIRYHGPAEYSTPVLNKYTGKTDFFPTVSLLEKDPARNKVIIDCLEEALADDHSVFVFCEHRLHAIHLAKLYKERSSAGRVNVAIEVDEIEGGDEPTSVVMMGGVSDEDLNIARTKAQVIFTTFSYSSTGVSVVKMSAIILASPRRSGTTQILGRAERRGADYSKERLFYDIVDQLSPLSKQFKTRNLVYKNKECIVEEKKVVG